MWKYYGVDGFFNYSVLPEELLKKGTKVKYGKNSVVVSRGEFPKNIFFIVEGVVTGVKEYPNGNVYSYFRLDKSNGSIGLLEIMARQEKYIATIVTVTEVKAIRIDSAVVYQTIMEDIKLLRRCSIILSDDLYKRSGNDGVLYYLSGIDRVRFFLTKYYEEHLTVQDQRERMIIRAEYQEIANTIGMSVRTVGRNLQKLRVSGEILSDRKRILIGEQQYEKLIENLYT